MTNEATTTGLLDIARDALRRDVLPALTGDPRFKAAMIANALAIVQRSLGGAGGWDEAAALAAICPEDAREDAARRDWLRQAIRGGALDAADRTLVADYLAPRVGARLAISQPDYRRIIPGA